ncbi:MAG: signal recognition particle protein, partial [Pedobacter sp.]
IQQIKKMGNIKDLMGMIPGVGKMMKNVDIDDNAFKGIESIIQSMTPHERENPDAINQSRRARIAKGSGSDIAEVNKLIKQFEDMRKVMKQFSDPSAMAKMQKMMKNMPGGGMGR